MREIKFRAWDKKGNCWIGGFCVHATGLFSDYWSPDNRQPTWWNSKEVEGRIFIMQYTGLKDKNGKEIYEGDIVETTINNEIVNRSNVVYGGQEFYLLTPPEENPCGVISQNRKEDQEVIGNIWEHEHLLNQNTEIVDR